ncbi:hypothetical protein ACFFIX_10610 [Metabacillus herbersteinensis]|uniref:Uncharacterized protein n=1 Tax=Metabacillus herbersteinensis TaxID=283816 RepID=A0ABV6GG48_9BACI
MGKLEYGFEIFLDGLYRHHDRNKRDHDQQMKRKDSELIELESVADTFDRKMESSADAMERWLIARRDKN